MINSRDFLAHGLFTLILGLLLAGGSVAQPLMLRGQVVQGGIIRGQVPEGHAVWLDGETLPLTARGDFIFGIPKDAMGAVALVIQSPEGEEIAHTIEPLPREFKVQRINGLPPTQVTPPEAVMARIQEDARLASAARTHISDLEGFTETFIWPTQGPITGVYGSQRILNGEPRAPHWGVDVAAPTGTPVVAPASGRVVLAHPDMYFSGGTLFLDHGHGLISAFLHLETIDVPEGSFVKQGEQIGTVGETGRATGPHLDWRVSWRHVRVDAQLLVDPQ